MTAETSHIPLDPALQVWVLLPISVVTLLMGLLRRNLTSLVIRPPPSSLPKIRDANLLKRASTVRQNSHYMPRSQFEARRFFFSTALKKPPSTSPMTSLMNPESLANQVLSICISIVPHMLLGTWARYSFAGVAVCRLPFTLTPRFRPMLQSGIEIAGLNLDISYVSSLSWYILNLFGNAGLLSIIAGGGDDDVFVPSVASQISMNVTPDRVFDKERESLMKAQHTYRVDDKEEALLIADPALFAAF